MRHVSKFAAVALLAFGALTVSATRASAAVACNAEGECWHVHAAYRYRPEFGVVIHPDGWRWGPGEHYRWREHRGRGYWRGGRWERF